MADEKNREQQSGKQKEKSQQKQNNPFSEQEKHGDEQQRRAPGNIEATSQDSAALPVLKRKRMTKKVRGREHRIRREGGGRVWLRPAPPTVANALLPPPR